MPKRMYHALRDAGVDEFLGLNKHRLPYGDWARRLNKLQLGCYAPAIGYIDDDEVKPGGVITAAGMFDTLLTKTQYQDWEGCLHRLNIMAMVIGGPATGKGFAVKQDEYIMEILRDADSEGRELERQYKEGINERETSQK